MPRITVTRIIPEPALKWLRAHGEVVVSPHDRPLQSAELHQLIRGSHAVVTLLHDTVDGAFLDAAGPNLRIVANVAVGYNNIDLEACGQRGVIVTNTPGVLTDATADIALALILMTTRRLAEGERHIRQQKPWNWHMFFMLGTGIQGRQLGIIGLGQIGTATAVRARSLGMNIAYTGLRRATKAREDELDATFVDLDTLLATSDIVSLHCPLTSDTHHLLDSERLRKMKPTAHLINTTRGPVVDEAALAAGLRDGVIAGAGLDVYENEPMVHPALLSLDNVVLIPHLGSATIETRTAMALLAAQNASAVLDGRPAPNQVT